MLGLVHLLASIVLEHRRRPQLYVLISLTVNGTATVVEGAEKSTEDCPHTLKHGMHSLKNKWCAVISVEW